MLSEARCPTFSWSGVPGARGYQIAVFRLSEEPGAEPSLFLRVSVPGDARAYTPPVGQCLERGARYAWSVAATRGALEVDEQHDWADAFLFEVEAAPSRDELEQAVDTIQRFLAANESRSDSGRAVASGQTAEQPAWRSRAAEDVAPSRASIAPRDHFASRTDARRSSGELLPGALTAPTIGDRASSAAIAPTAGTASLKVANQIELSPQSAVFVGNTIFLWAKAGNTALGLNALQSNESFGVDNTAIGYAALISNTSGEDNTAIGAYALINNTDDDANTAVGSYALYSNLNGSRNVAVGRLALLENEDGSDNTAIGSFSLYSNPSGSGNTALGHRAGFAPNLAANSIFINNEGLVEDTATIKIGTSGVQTTAFIAGNLGLGFSSASATAPDNRLHVKESINLDNEPENHVVQIENTNTGAEADVLALRIGRNHVDTTNPIGGGNVFISFLDGDGTTVGFVRGTSIGGVQFGSSDADFAEWLPRLDPTETLSAGDVVGLHGGALSKSTQGASRVFAVSTAPLIIGNDPGEGRYDDHALVAFLGQAPVNVRGSVRAGDLLVASGRGDGSAIARAPNEVSVSHELVVGRALEGSSSETGTHLVRALVGLDGAATMTPNRAVERDLARLERRVRELEARSSSSERPTRNEAAPTRRR